MEYKLAALTSSDTASFIRLLDTCFGITYSDPTKAVTWKFFDPFFKEKQIIFVAKSGKTVVSQYTAAPITITADQDFSSTLCFDMATLPSHRGKKLISKLSTLVYTEVKKRQVPFSIGFSNESGVKVDKNAKDYGYKVVGKFAVYITYTLFPKKTKYTLEETDMIDEIVTHSEMFRIKKTQEYMNWRYIKRPGNLYKMYAITSSSKMCGYVVARIIDNKFYVYDIITKEYDKKNIVEIIRAVENKAIELKKKVLIIKVLENKYWKDIFFYLTYVKKRYNSHESYLTVNIHDASYKGIGLLQKDNWFCMAGDIL